MAADFETALAIRQPVFDQFGQHNRGEYLSGLAESWGLAGKRDKAESYLRRILVELSNSPYAERCSKARRLERPTPPQLSDLSLDPPPA